jgi:DNA-binding transcriptional MerR regulator
MSSTLLISELAEQTGFTPSALRYYEQVGLLTASSRTPAGYRLYDETAAGRLRFIARAKRLGLPLDDIRDLVAIWDGSRCAHVQERLRAQVEAKSLEVQARIEELSRFAKELASARAELSGQSPEGPCGDGCGCTSDGPSSTPPKLLELTPTTRRGGAAGVGAQPVSTRRFDSALACTLGAADQPARLVEWQVVVAMASRREAIEGGVSLTFPFDSVLASRLADLAIREQTCCAFFDFALRINGGSLVLEVRAPDTAAHVIAGLFGAA